MKQPKLSDLKVNQKETAKIRSMATKAKKVKVTINIDSDVIKAAKAISAETGVPYQRLINRLLRAAVVKNRDNSSRLDRLEKELSKLKKMVA